MPSTVVHASIHLQPTDTPTAASVPSALYPDQSTVWVAMGDAVQVYPATPAQADALSLAFAEAAQLLRETTQ